MWCVMVTPPSPQQITLGDIFSDFHSKYSVDPPSQSHSLTLTHAHTHTRTLKDITILMLMSSVTVMSAKLSGVEWTSQTL